MMHSDDGDEKQALLSSGKAHSYADYDTSSASDASAEVQHLLKEIEAGNKVPLVYHPRYNINAFGLEIFHPFDSKKYGRIHQFLLNSKLVSPSQFIEPEPATDEQIKMVHTESYLYRISWSLYLTFILDVPCTMCVPNCLVRRQVLMPMLYAVGGTILATQLAYEHGWAINLSGGYHHASADEGGGFCVYADITIAIRIMQQKYFPKFHKVMIVDLDAHQGNGHERDFMGEKDTVFIFDMYCVPNYPMDHEAKKAISANIPMDLHITDKPYLDLLRKRLPEAIDKFQPDLIFYNAGTDILINDAMGGMSVSKNGIIQRDEFVFENAFTRGIPIVMVMSGGYQQSNARIIADSIVNLESKFGILSNKFKAMKVTQQDNIEEDELLNS